MCGVAGLFNICDYSFENQISFLNSAMDEMNMRGPDDSGLWCHDGVLIGHRRLAVIDVDGAKQPWVDKDTGCVLTFNGEIYNFVDLQKQLQALGHQFQSRSDTEVLLKAYIEWGQECLDYLDGMFAFAVYDPREQSLFLARDRLGVKPLFYYEHEGGLVFASSIAALVKIPFVSRKLYLPAASHYLTTLRTTLGQFSMIEGIYCLQPGHRLLMTKKAPARVQQYWEYPILSPEEKKQLKFSDAVEEVAEKVASAVNKQLVSDVNVGCFLSGGLDSSIITSLLSQQQDPCKVYNVGYRDEGFNEWKYVNQVSNAFSLDCKIEELFASDYQSVWKHLIKSKGLPLSSPNEVPIYHLAKLLKQECTVALSGEGADEVFSGYGIPYFSAYDFDRSHKMSLEKGSDALSPLQLSLHNFYGRSSFGSRLDHFFQLNSWISFADKCQLLTAESWQNLEQDNQLFNYYESLFARINKCSTFDQYMHVHARINLEGLLFRVDSSTMAASVEARVPFTDHYLTEYLFSMPDQYKMNWISDQARSKGENLSAVECDRLGLFDTKRLLRSAFKESMPESILKRPKMSFPVPFMSWFGSVWKEEAREMINDVAGLDKLFNHEVIEYCLETSEQASSSQILWPVCNLALWVKALDIKI